MAYYPKRFFSIQLLWPLLLPIVYSVTEHLAEAPLRICSDKTTQAVRNVAIIGAGSAGASTAYYLDKFKTHDQRLNVTVFERSDYVGGRSTTAFIYDDIEQPLELGASIFVKINRNLVSAAEELGLSYSAPLESGPGTAPDALGVWDGTSFRYKTSHSSSWWSDLIRLLWKYGFAPYRLNNLRQATVSSFLKLYGPPHFPFYNLGTAAIRVNLQNALSHTGEEFLAMSSISREFSTDIIQASTLVNYAQSLNQIHGLETMVAMSADGAVSIDGGNWQIFNEMIKISGAKLALNTAVSQISRDDKGKFAVTVFPNATKPSTTLFDEVVIAAPFQYAGISIKPRPARIPKSTPYVELHVTLLTSPHPLSGAYFHEVDVIPPEIILTTLPNGESSGPKAGPSTPHPFFSISTLRRTLNKDYVPPRPEYAYKIFSPQPLNASFVSSILGFDTDAVNIGDVEKHHISWLRQKTWRSYPYLETIEGEDFFDGPALGKNLWYTSGVERFISTMETSSWMGMNVAKLIVNELQADKKECAICEHKVTTSDNSEL